MKILRVSTAVERFRAQLLLPRAAAVGRPIAAEIAHLAGSREMGQLGQCSAKNGYIALPVVWRPKGATNGMIDEGGARRPNLAHDVARRANDEGRNSLALDHVGDETDGLIAEGSVSRLNSNRRRLGGGVLHHDGEIFERHAICRWSPDTITAPPGAVQPGKSDKSELSLSIW
jgi:hypothetical protein